MLTYLKYAPLRCSKNPAIQLARATSETASQSSPCARRGGHGNQGARQPRSRNTLSDLFESGASKDYGAKDIEVLEGLEPVRRRPGMYIGGTDETALHHLAAEILDNSMDEAVAGHASVIEMTLEPGNKLTVRDNGRGIPVDPHPKFKDKSRARGDPHHAALGRQILRQGLCHLGRPARRRLLGGQRAVHQLHGRSRARQEALPPGLCPRHAADQTRRGRSGAEPPRHLHQLHPGYRDFRRR